MSSVISTKNALHIPKANDFNPRVSFIGSDPALRNFMVLVCLIFWPTFATYCCKWADVLHPKATNSADSEVIGVQ